MSKTIEPEDIDLKIKLRDFLTKKNVSYSCAVDIAAWVIDEGYRKPPVVEAPVNSTEKEVEELNKIIQALDTAVGMLLVPAMKDKTVKTAMEKVSQCSFLLGEIINGN